MENIQSKLEDLDTQRKKLRKRAFLLFPIFLLIPSVSLLAVMNFDNPDVVFGIIAAITLLTGVIYSFIIMQPLYKLKTKLRTALLEEFMKNYYQEIDYKYQRAAFKGKKIIKSAGLITPDRYIEEDVIEGHHKDIEFYISEVNLKKKVGKGERSIFKGMLFKLKVPGKNYTESSIESKPGLIKRIITGFKKNEEYGFLYETKNDVKFNKELKALFPFIRHLIKKQNDLRIKVKGDEITIMMASKAKFLDNPRPSLYRTFFNKRYFTNIAQQLNSFMFIIQSFVEDWDESEIEEKLELEVLELAKPLASIQKQRNR